jgi:hypothetical protein
MVLYILTFTFLDSRRDEIKFINYMNQFTPAFCEHGYMDYVYTNNKTVKIRVDEYNTFPRKLQHVYQCRTIRFDMATWYVRITDSLHLTVVQAFYESLWSKSLYLNRTGRGVNSESKLKSYVGSKTNYDLNVRFYNFYTWNVSYTFDPLWERGALSFETLCIGSGL